MSEPTYSSAGVNTVKEEAALAGLLTWVGKTLAFGRYRSALDFGYFATRPGPGEQPRSRPVVRRGRHQAPRGGDAGQVRHRRHRLHRHECQRPALRGRGAPGHAGLHRRPGGRSGHAGGDREGAVRGGATGEHLHPGRRDRPGPRVDQGRARGAGLRPGRRLCRHRPHGPHHHRPGHPAGTTWSSASGAAGSTATA